MPLGRQMFRRSLAEALAAFLGQRHSTAKQIARATGIDPSTAENLRKGHLSVTTLEKVLSVEGRGLWERLGDELFGETFHEYEERRLRTIIQEAEDARENLVRLRARAAAVESRTWALDDLRPRQGDEPDGPSAGGAGASADGSRQRRARRQGSDDGSQR